MSVESKIELKSPLHGILAPRSVAVIGASNDPRKRGYQAIKRLLADRFPGPIYPINPRQSEVLGLQAYPNICDVDGPIDLALVCTPAKTLPAVVADCGRKGVKGAVVLAAGFGEVGAQGQAIEDAMLEAAGRYNVRLIGPNTNGVFNLNQRLNLVGVSDAEPGDIGIVSQSGNMMLALLSEGQRRGQVGFSTFIGVGNQADVRFNEYLEYFGEDKNTAVPVFYVEGFKNGRQFLDAAREVTPQKPVVVYKSGRTEAGKRSAGSHTGSLAGSFQLTRDLLRQAGVTVVEQSDKILSIAEGLSLVPPAAGNRVAVLADSGGHGTIITDTLIEHGLALAELSDETRTSLTALLPAQASLANPVDVAGGTDEDPSVFADCARVLLEDQGVDLLLIAGMYGGYAVRFSSSLLGNEVETSVRLGALARRFSKPILVQSLYGTLKPEPLVVLKEAGVPVFIWPENAVRCATEVVRYGQARRRLESAPLIAAGPPPPAAGAIVAAAREAKRDSLYEFEAKALLDAYGIEGAQQRVLRSRDDIAEAAGHFGERPVAMKIVSEDILHKSDAGGVKLGVVGESAISAAYQQILTNARGYNEHARIEGVLVAPMARPGVEVIIGVVQDPIFGPVIMFGLGGILVEVLHDVAFRSVPLSRADAEEMIEQISAKKILDGVRGQPPVDRQALVELIVKVSTLVQDHPEIAEVDLNPVIARNDGCEVVDARMIFRSAT